MSAIDLFSVSDVRYIVGWESAPYTPTHGRLVYVLAGSAVYTVSDTLYPVKAGECFWLPPDVANSHKPIEKEAFLTRIFRFHIEDPVLNTRLSNIYQPLKVDDSMKGMLDYLNNYWNVDDAVNKSTIDAFSISILNLFFINEVHFSKTSSFVSSSHYSPATQRVLWFIENNITSTFSMDKLSESLGYNKKYLSSAFKRDTGISITEYRNFHRIRLAIVVFIYWKYSVAKTCNHLRFESLSYFSQLFKTFTGVSPRVFYQASAKLSPERLTQITSSEPLLARYRVSVDVLLASMRHLGETMQDILQCSSQQYVPSESSSSSVLF